MSGAALMGNYGIQPVTFARGAGSELYDDGGRRYLDFLSGLAVTSLGHAHPAVTAALREQADRLMHVSNLFANEITAEVVERIDRLIRGGAGEPGRVLFQNSGAEANEAAIKLARKHQGRGRHAVVSALRSFHGRTLATLAATGQPEKHEPFQPLPEGFRHVPWNDLGELESALGPEVGTVLLEPLQGEGGVNPAADGYLRGVRELCDQRGITLVMDEIQTGLGPNASPASMSSACKRSSASKPNLSMASPVNAMKAAPSQSARASEITAFGSSIFSPSIAHRPPVVTLNAPVAGE